jgi:hypothetical protein
MRKSPSWEANSQEIPRLSWNPTVRYRVHERQPIPRYGNAVHVFF